jgi:two-component system, cell cycle response regulator
LPPFISGTKWVGGAVVGQPRIILVDVSEASREVMVRRLNAQGYEVEAAGDPVSAADLALAAPPAAVIADLWMPNLSGVHLCRLLRTEPATADVPVILRGATDDPRSRFWAERAGAAGYVRKGRMGDLVRVLSRAVASRANDDGFFMQLGGGDTDIRDRVAHYLDNALFESVVAAEVRSLSASGSFERLFDLFAQFLAQVIQYRWLALATTAPRYFALHHHPGNAAVAEAQARDVLRIAPDTALLRVVDEDPCADLEGPAVVISSVPFGGSELGTLALAPGPASEADTVQLVALVARELGGPVRIAALMDEQKRLASIDPLTGLRNRRAFVEQARIEVARAARYRCPLGVLLLDVDHFKAVNDGRGHAAGDRVLAVLGELLSQLLRTPDVAARWGGEEFVLLLPSTDLVGTKVVGERVRLTVENHAIEYEGNTIPISVSVGAAAYVPGESLEAFIDRADRAMYVAKAGGRNRVVVAEEQPLGLVPPAAAQ